MLKLYIEKFVEIFWDGFLPGERWESNTWNQVIQIHSKKPCSPPTSLPQWKFIWESSRTLTFLCHDIDDLWDALAYLTLDEAFLSSVWWSDLKGACKVWYYERYWWNEWKRCRCVWESTKIETTGTYKLWRSDRLNIMSNALRYVKEPPLYFVLNFLSCRRCNQRTYLQAYDQNYRIPEFEGSKYTQAC